MIIITQLIRSLSFRIIRLYTMIHVLLVIFKIGATVCFVCFDDI